MLVEDLRIGNKGYTPSRPRRGKEQDHADQNLPHDEPDEDRKPEIHHQDPAAHASDDAYLDGSADVASEEETQKEELARDVRSGLDAACVTALTADAYGELWKKFRRENRLEFGGHTDPSWRDGHNSSASFLVPVEAESIREGLKSLRASLRGFPFVSLHPDHFLHITLLLPGFLVAEPQGPNELSAGRLEELAYGAREVLAGFPPFSVQLRNLNAFPGAIFVEVHDRGELGEIRGAIRARCGLPEPLGPPHLTVAYIHTPDGTPAPKRLVETIQRHRDTRVGRLDVDRVDLTLLDLGKEYPEPQIVAGVPLGGRPADREQALRGLGGRTGDEQSGRK